MKEKFGSNRACNLSNVIQVFLSEMFEVLEVGVVRLGGVEAYGRAYISPRLSSSDDNDVMCYETDHTINVAAGSRIETTLLPSV